jgi:hypothetical protein
MGHLQIKDMPDELHGELRRRADRAGMSMRDYVLALIERDQRRPPVADWLTQVRGRAAVPLSGSGADEIRAARAERDAG